MVTTILHYIYDPLCGWCYGASPLVAAARKLVAVRAHGGGMMAGPNRQAVTPQLRAFVAPHDQRIAQLTGQPFGDAYTNGLLRDTSAVLDSEPPTAAVLAAEGAGARGLDMLARLQVAHYVEGRRIADRSVLIELAAELGLVPGTFEQALQRAEGEATQRHIAESRALLAKLGGHGFPTFALERDGRIDLIDIHQYLARPSATDRLAKGAGPPRL
ncbi:MAG TPA: DsbA family protein [Burkholderiaceae bacterium]|nr:DsbA family protein [Burkholderiaceae bacterium]